MGFWITILAAIILAVAFPIKIGDTGTSASHKPSDFRDNEFDDEIEDYDRMLDEEL